LDPRNDLDPCFDAQQEYPSCASTSDFLVLMQNLPVSTSSERFRPHFVIDEQMRIRVWPEAIARALGIPETRARGLPCWQLLANHANCQACRDNDEYAPPTSRCARLRAPSGGHGWLVWSPPALIAEGPAGSAVLEWVLLRGALAECLAQGSLEDTLEAIRRACAADDCELFLLGPGEQEVALRGCVGQDRAAFLERTTMPLGVGYPGWITATGKPLSTTRFQRDRRFQREAVKQRGIRTFVGVPLIEGGRAIGYLGLAWKDDVPVDWILHLLEAARPIAVAAARLTYGAPQPSPSAITVRCLGAFVIVGEAGALGVAGFPRRKSLDLLRHLLLARGTAVSRDTLIEYLWPEVDPETGANRLHVALHALRGVLRQALPDASARLVQHRHGHYRIDIDALGPVDAFQFADALDEARRCAHRGELAEALRCLEQALPLYQGELFADADDIVFEAPRQRFRDRYREALRLLVDLYLRQDRVDAALAALTEARERAALDSDWHDALLHKVAERGRLPHVRRIRSGP
jgi:DNA-binding SARP family transcriptional activator